MIIRMRSSVVLAEQRRRELIDFSLVLHGLGTGRRRGVAQPEPHPQLGLGRVPHRHRLREGARAQGGDNVAARLVQGQLHRLGNGDLNKKTVNCLYCYVLPVHYLILPRGKRTMAIMVSNFALV